MNKNEVSCLRVSIVDDDPFMREFLQSMLEKLGVDQIATYEQANDALLTLDTSPPPWDLILLDIHMPEVDGIEFIQALASRRFGGAVLVLSGAAEVIRNTTARLGQRHGLTIVDCLPKPPTQEQLLATLQQVSRARNFKAE